MLYRKSLYLLTPLYLFIDAEHRTFGMQEEIQLSREECEKICQDCNEETSETCANFCRKYYDSSAIIRDCIDFHHMIKESEKSFIEEQKRAEEQFRREHDARLRAEAEQRRVEEQRRREQELAEQRRIEALKKEPVKQPPRALPPIPQPKSLVPVEVKPVIKDKEPLTKPPRALPPLPQPKPSSELSDPGVVSKPTQVPIPPKPPSPVVTHHELPKPPAEIDERIGLGDEEKALIMKRRGQLDESSEEEEEDLAISVGPIPSVDPITFWENKIRNLESQLEYAKKIHEEETNLLKRNQHYDRVKTLTRELVEAKRQLAAEQNQAAGQNAPTPIDWAAVQKAMEQQRKTK